MNSTKATCKSHTKYSAGDKNDSYQSTIGHRSPQKTVKIKLQSIERRKGEVRSALDQRKAGRERQEEDSIRLRIIIGLLILPFGQPRAFCRHWYVTMEVARENCFLDKQKQLDEGILLFQLVNFLQSNRLILLCQKITFSLIPKKVIFYKKTLIFFINNFFIN